jgi:hypothetical protein
MSFDERGAEFEPGHSWHLEQWFGCWDSNRNVSKNPVINPVLSNNIIQKGLASDGHWSGTPASLR